MATNTKDPKKSGAAHADEAATRVSAKLSGPLAPLEKALDGALGEKAPYKIPKEGREAIVKYSPWISLVVGLFSLFSAFSLWRAAHRVSELVDYANKLTASFGGPVQNTRNLGIMFWLTIVFLIVTGVLALLAFPGLQARKKTGWNLMFYSSLAGLAYSVVSLFYDGAGFSSFIGTVIGTVLGLYILFQVRSYYKA